MNDQEKANQLEQVLSARTIEDEFDRGWQAGVQAVAEWLRNYDKIT